MQKTNINKCGVLSAVHFIEEAWHLIIPTTVKNFLVKCGFWIVHISSSDDSAAKLTEIRKMTGIVYSLLGVQFEDYVMCDIAVRVCKFRCLRRC
jgi:hypothetical protein